MSIPKKIQELAELALRDRVLTRLERETIVNAALKEGVDINEINSFVDNALRERLKYFTKEELCDCPFCGAQIPLVSDTCLFCGRSLEHTEAHTVVPPTFTEQSAEAKIIQGENIRVEQERYNLRTCPDCGAPFPFISNICLSCGHVLHDQKDSDLNMKTLSDNLNRHISELRDIGSSSFLKLFASRFLFLSVLMLPLVVVAYYCFNKQPVFLIVGGVLVFVGLLMRFAFFVVKKQSDSYERALHYGTMYVRLVDTLYGRNPEAQRLLCTYTDEINRISSIRRRSNRQWIVSAVVCIAIPALAILFTTIFAKVNADAIANAKIQADAAEYARDSKLPINIPEIPEIAAFSKVLQPYPSKEVRAVQEIELTFYPKDSDAELSYRILFRNVTFTCLTHYYGNFIACIQLLDSKRKPVSGLGVIRNAGIERWGEYYDFLPWADCYTLDFYSEQSSSSKELLLDIAERACYYSIILKKID